MIRPRHFDKINNDAAPYFNDTPRFFHYNPNHNILELYKVLVQVRFATTKTELDTLVYKTLNMCCFTTCQITSDLGI